MDEDQNPQKQQPQSAPETEKKATPSDAPVPVPPTKANPELALIGQEISGCVILEKISSGGMGTVFKAKHKALNRIVCVKILSPSLANDKKAVGLFLTEARAIAEIDHPNIVFVYNVGREKGFYFIVMSFIEGESLSSIVRKKPNLPLSFVVDTFIGILRGLEAAHQKGIIHRDIKPSNILINKRLEPKIVDFGIAKKVDKDKGCTKTTELAGTAYFLSPEQALGRAIDTRADLYSLGASLFYVLTARYPFTGKNSMDIIQKHINEPVPEVSSYRKGLPTWLSAAVTKLMAKDPKDRFQTATEALVYFQKMRADDQLKVSQGVNIADEMGLKLSSHDIGASPRLEDTPKEARNNRFNMDVTERVANTSSRSSIPIVSLGDPVKPKASLFDAEETAPPSRPRVKEKLRPMYKESRAKSGASVKAAIFFRNFMSFAIAMGMMIAGAFLFMKLGALCSATDITDKTFFKALAAPWVAQEFLPGQMLWASAAFVFFVFTLAMLFFNRVSKIAPIVLLVCVLSYVAAFFGYAPAEITDWRASTFLILYAFVFGALAIKVDESDYVRFYIRILGLIFLALAFYFINGFFRPEFFESGPFTQSLFYSTIGLVAAAFVLPFLRGSFIYRMATVVLFVSACASIWVYQTSGNVYHTLGQIQISEAPAATPAEEEPELEASLTYEIKGFKYAYEPLEPLAPLQEELLSAGDFAGDGLPAEAREEEQAEAAPLTPAEIRALFLEKLNEMAPAMTRTEIERHVWMFALQEPFEKFKYNYKQEGFIFFSIIAIIMYGAFMFLISLFEDREDRWNLI